MKRYVTVFATSALVAMLTAVFAAPAIATHLFSDVADGVPEEEFIQWAQDNGIYTGYGNCESTQGAEHLDGGEPCEPGAGQFGYRDGITREQMAVVLQRVNDNVIAPGDAALQAQVDAVNDCPGEWINVPVETEGAENVPQRWVDDLEGENVATVHLCVTKSEPEPTPPATEEPTP